MSDRGAQARDIQRTGFQDALKGILKQNTDGRRRDDLAFSIRSGDGKTPIETSAYSRIFIQRLAAWGKATLLNRGRPGQFENPAVQGFAMMVPPETARS